MEELLTIAAAAQELGIKYSTMHRWVSVKKALPSQAIGNGAVFVVKRSDFERFASDYKAGRYERWPK